MEELPRIPPASQPSDSKIASATGVLQNIDKRLWKEIDEANELLEWAVSSGRGIHKDIVIQIKKSQNLLSTPQLDQSARADFEYAYAQLAMAVSPVTFGTIRATTDKHGDNSCLAPVHLCINMYRKILRPGKPTIYISRARVWSRMLWIWTILFLILILFGEHLEGYIKAYSASVQAPDKSESIEWSRLTYWLKKIVPFCYGALGASAYLLRSCHKHIHERTFDPRRLPEYYNRLLLGFLSGGTILLYLNPDQNPAKIGAAGLAFLAGYSTDFFFTYIERIIDALTPKSPISPSISSSSSLTPPSSTQTTPPPSTTASPPPPGHT